MQPPRVYCEHDHEHLYGQHQMNRLKHLDNSRRRASIKIIYVENDSVDSRKTVTDNIVPIDLSVVASQQLGHMLKVLADLGHQSKRLPIRAVGRAVCDYAGKLTRRRQIAQFSLQCLDC
ncbi:hypothetical protein EB72_03300 [Mycobacterium sp. SWH-M1]|nr:hypothetical protein EB72_03300 [Mycobacterium sp. SWH-M1]